MKTQDSTRIAPCGRRDPRSRVRRRRRDHRAGAARRLRERPRPASTARREPRAVEPRPRPSRSAARSRCGTRYGSGGGETGAFQKALGADPRGEQGPQGQRRRAAVQRHLQQVARPTSPPAAAPTCSSPRTTACSPRPTRASLADLDDRARRASSTASARSRSTAPRSTASSTWSPSPSRPWPCGTTSPTVADRPGHDRRAPRRRQGRLDQARPQPERVPLASASAGAFGGTLMDDTGKCVADQAGFADAFKYLKPTSRPPAPSSTRTATPSSRTSRPASSTPIIDGPWQTADFTQGPRRQARRRADPGRPDRPGEPAHRHRRLVHQPQQPEHRPRRRARPPARRHRERAGHDDGRRPRACGPGRHDRPTRSSRASPTRRPPASRARRRAEFNNYWGPFGDALNQVIDKGADADRRPSPTPARPMNEANGK